MSSSLWAGDLTHQEDPWPAPWAGQPRAVEQKRTYICCSAEGTLPTAVCTVLLL